MYKGSRYEALAKQMKWYDWAILIGALVLAAYGACKLP